MVTVTPLKFVKVPGQVTPCVSEVTPFAEEDNSHIAEGTILNDWRSLPLPAGGLGVL